jgi:PAS domain S-box-containing protein
MPASYKRSSASMREPVKGVSSASSTRYRDFFSSLHLAVIYHDTSLHVLDANQAAKNLLGFHLQKPGEKTAFDYGWPATHLDGSAFTKNEHPVQQALNQKKPVLDIIMAIDSTQRWFKVSAIPLFHRGSHRPYQVVTTWDDVTERYRDARSIQQSEEQYQSIIETANEGIWLIDHHMRTIYANTYMAQVLHTTSEEIMAHSILDFCTTQDEALVRNRFADTLKGKSFHLDFRLRAADDDIVFVFASVGPLWDRHGAITGVLGVFSDITERHNTETILREVNERLTLATLEADDRTRELQATIGSMADGLAIIDRDGRVIQHNSACEQLFGCKQCPELLLISLSEWRDAFSISDSNENLLSIEETPQMRTLRGEVLAGINAMDMLIHTPDGRKIEVSVTGAPIVDAQGKITHAVNVYRDVTERRRLEKQAQTTLEAVLDLAQLVVMVPSFMEKDRQISQILVETVCQILPAQQCSLTLIDPVTEMLTTHAVAGHSPAISEMARQRGEKATFSDRVLDPEHRRKFWDGEIVVIDLTQPLYAEANQIYERNQVLLAPLMVNNNVIGMLTATSFDTHHDFTFQDIQTAKMVAYLVAMVIDRERLAHERANIMARIIGLEEANRRMDEFLGIVSHELKTPLTSIKMNLQITGKDLAHIPQEFSVHNQIENARTKIGKIDHQVNRITDLINDLLDVTRIQTNKLEYHMAECDAAEIVTDVVNEMRLIVPNRIIHLDLQPDVAFPIIGDSERLGQVVTNYLTNALKYSPAEQQIDIRVWQAGGSVWVSVTDYGPGIPAEEHERIWERFHRVPGIRVVSGSGVGLGLGLHLCKTIIEQHNGRVGVISQLGQGATFWFTLLSAPQGGERS